MTWIKARWACLSIAMRVAVIAATAAAMVVAA